MFSPLLPIEKKYVALLGGQLERFKKKSDSVWVFRCPICGDSKKNKHKTRGHFYSEKGKIKFKCHNCNAAMAFYKFLKIISPSLYRDYTIEALGNSSNKNFSNVENFLSSVPDIAETPVELTQKKINLQSILELKSDHFARRYVTERKIPQQYWTEIYYAPTFVQFVKELLPEQFGTNGENGHDFKRAGSEPRLIFPFYDQQNTLLGISARDLLGKAPAKYITCKVHEAALKIYGLNHVDLSKKVYVLEGPIDSLFLYNALAMMDGNLNRFDQAVGNLSIISKTLVPDNQPRNKEVVRMIKKCIDDGYEIFIWPNEIIDCKDINDLVLAGYSQAEIHDLIERNTYSGMAATFAFSNWTKL